MHENLNAMNHLNSAQNSCTSINIYGGVPFTFFSNPFLEGGRWNTEYKIRLDSIIPWIAYVPAIRYFCWWIFIYLFLILGVGHMQMTAPSKHSQVIAEHVKKKIYILNEMDVCRAISFKKIRASYRSHSNLNEKRKNKCHWLIQLLAWWFSVDQKRQRLCI